MRLLKHPGRPLQPRRLIAEARAGGEWRCLLPEGALLGDLAGRLAARGVEQAAIQLLGGAFARFEYRCGEPAEAGAGPLLDEGERRSLDGACPLVGGSAILGRGLDGGPRLHAHALVVGPDGVLAGGRLEPAGCRVGPDGLAVQVVALAGAGFAAAQDEETGATLFEPRVEGA